MQTANANAERKPVCPGTGRQVLSSMRPWTAYMDEKLGDGADHARLSGLIWITLRSTELGDGSSLL